MQAIANGPQTDCARCCMNCVAHYLNSLLVSSIASREIYTMHLHIIAYFVCGKMTSEWPSLLCILMCVWNTRRLCIHNYNTYLPVQLAERSINLSTVCNTSINGRSLWENAATENAFQKKKKNPKRKKKKY